jgi:hypothetical protein
MTDDFYDPSTHEHHWGEAEEHEHRFSLLLWQHDGTSMMELHRWDSACDPGGASMTNLIAALREVADKLDGEHQKLKAAEEGKN